MALFDTYTLSWLKIARIKIYWKLPHQLYVLNLLDMNDYCKVSIFCRDIQSILSFCTFIHSADDLYVDGYYGRTYMTLRNMKNRTKIHKTPTKLESTIVYTNHQHPTHPKILQHLRFTKSNLVQLHILVDVKSIIHSKCLLFKCIFLIHMHYHGKK